MEQAYIGTFSIKDRRALTAARPQASRHAAAGLDRPAVAVQSEVAFLHTIRAFARFSGDTWLT